MTYTTIDGKKFTNYNEAIKHEANLKEAERIAKERDKEKENKYTKLLEKIGSLRKEIDEYNKTYGTNISLSLTNIEFKKDRENDKNKNNDTTNNLDTIIDMLSKLF